VAPRYKLVSLDMFTFSEENVEEEFVYSTQNV
jgi:hypothetical protein